MQPFSSLRSRLLLLVLLAALPVFGLLAYTESEYRNDESEEINANALRFTHRVAGEYSQLINGTRQLLIALAQFDAIRKQEVAGCNAHMAALLKQFPQYDNFSATESDGAVFCSALLMTGTLSASDRSYFQRAMLSRDFAIGEYVTSRLTGRPTIVLAYPVLDDANQPQGIVFASLNLTLLSQLAVETQLPAGETLTVLDRHGVVLARYPDSEKWVSRTWPEQLITQALLNQLGNRTGEFTDADGVRRLYTFIPIGASPGANDLYIGVGIPKQVAYAEADRISNRNLLAMGGVLLLALVATWIFSDIFILRKTNALVRATQRLSSGDLSTRTGLRYGTGELSQLARTFDQMAGSLQQRETARKQAEEMLRRNEERYRSLFENMLDGFAYCKMLFENNQPYDFVYLGINSAFEKLTGLKDVVGKQVTEVIPGIKESNPELFEIYGRVALTGQPERFEVYLDSLKIWLSISVYSTEKEYFVAVFDNITERKRAEETLRVSEDRFRDLVEHSQELMCTHDLQGRILSVNPAALKMIGYPEDVILKMNVRDLLVRGTRDQFDGYLAALQRDGVASGLMLVQDSKGEKQIWDYYNTVRIEGLAAPIVRGMARDITERKRAEKEILRRNQELGTLNRIGLALNKLVEPEKIFEMIFEALGQVLDNRNLYIALYDEEKQSISFPLYAMNGQRRAPGSRPFSNSLTEFVIKTKAPLLISQDMEEELERRAIALIGTPSCCFLAVPMIIGEQVLGVIGVQDYETPGVYDSSHLELLSTFASQAAIALENARLFSETQRRANEFAALYETARDLATQNDLAALLQKVVKRAMDLLNAPTAAMHLYDPTTEQIVLTAGIGITLPLGTRLNLGEGAAGRAAQTRQPVIVDDYSTWEHRIAKSANFEGLTYGAVLNVPMLYGGELIGVLGLHEISASTRTFTEQDARLLSLFAGQAASAVHNARLLAQATQRAEQLALLYDAGLTLNRVLEPRIQLEFLFKITIKALRADRAEFFRFDPVNNDLSLEMGIGYEPHALDGLRTIHFRLGEERGLVGRVAQTHLPLYIPDVSSDPRWLAFDAHIHSGLWVPVQHENQLQGVLAVFSPHKDAFTPQDERLLVLFANQAAVALENTQQLELTKKHAQRQEVLYRISASLASPQRVRELCEIVVRAGQKTLGFPYMGIFLLEPETGDRVLQAHSGWDDAPSDWRLHPGEGLSNKAITCGELQYWRDISREPSYLCGLRDSGCELDVPIKSGDKVLGVLIVEDHRVDAFDAEDFELLQAVTNQLAVALEKARLFQELQTSLNMSTRLYELSGEIISATSLEETARAITETLQKAFAADSATIRLVDAQGRTEFHYGTGLELARFRKAEPRPTGMTARILETGKPLIASSLEMIHPDARAEGIQATIGLPLRSDSHTLGTLFLGYLQPHSFGEHEVELLSLFANQAALALERVRLLDETHHRLAEMEAVNKISTALRAAQSLEEMLPRLLDETLATLNMSDGNIWLYEPRSGELRNAIARGWLSEILPPVKSSEGIVGHVFTTGAVYHSSDVKQDPRLRDSVRSYVPEKYSGLALPIRTSTEIIGVLFVSFPSPRELAAAETHLLMTIAEIAGNAIHRMRLHEATEQQLHRLAALREVDKTITSSFDLRFSLKSILDQVMSQLRVDAAAFLMFDAVTQSLEYAAARGFRRPAINQARLRVGEGLAGRATLEQKTITLRGLSESPKILEKTPWLVGENFVTAFALPLIAKGKVKGVLELYHRSPLAPDSEWLDFMETLAGQAAIAIDNANLFEELQRSNAELFIAYDSTLEGWSRALDLRDKETEGHTQRVTELTVRLASMMGVTDRELVHIRRGALLHDIGKMGIPDNILHKPETLTIDEWKIMRTHPSLAYELLAPISYLKYALEIPYCHHEKWDGTGYPRGLKGKEIPLSARIFAVTDVWDALLSDRPYRPAWSEEKAREYIRVAAGTHFDPKVVEPFLGMLSESLPVHSASMLSVVT